MFKNPKIYIAVVIVFLVMILANFVTAQEISIVQISDVHLDTTRADGKVRKFTKSVEMLQKAIKKINYISPDIVVFSGDMVNRPIESDFDLFLSNASNLNTEFYPILGNHDVGVGGGLSKSLIIKKINKTCNWLHLEKPYYSVVKGEYIFIFMDGTTDKTLTSTGFFSNEVLNFLDRTLTDNPYKKAIIVQHFPLIPPFKSPSHEITNKDQYFDVISKHPNVIMVLCGHFHASKAAQRNNVLYVTTPSMIEYPHAFRYLTVRSNKDDIVITSQLIVDQEQNDLEQTTDAVSRLKLGRDSDNNFTVKLKNRVPQEPISESVGKIFSK